MASNDRPRYPFDEPDPLVTTAPIREVVAAIESLDLDAPWEEVRNRLRLVLPRRRPMPPDTGSLPERTWAPGLRVGLGLDVGPAMLFVTQDQIDGWGVSEDEVFNQAESNIRERLGARRQFALLREQIDGIPTIAFQSREGWASTLLLMPDALCRVLGERSGLVLAPMRDLVLRLPLDTDPELAEWILGEFAEADMNALDVPVLALVDGQLTKASAGRTAPGGTTRTH